MKKLSQFILITILTFISLFFISFDVKADENWMLPGNVAAPVVTDVKYEGCENSVKIENSDYACVNAKRTFTVEPNSYYRASVMVYYEGYELHPDVKYDSGAFLGDTNKGATANRKSEWVRQTFDFTTGEDQREYVLALWNGYYASDCKGTAYFSNFVLEEATSYVTNSDWNILMLVFGHVKAPVVVDGESKIYEDYLTEEDANEFKSIASHLGSSLTHLSEGIWNVKAVDMFYTQSTITKLIPYGDCSYYVDYTGDAVSSEIDKYLELVKNTSGRQYNQIIVIAPINGEVNSEWFGIGGGTYRGIYICQVTYKTGDRFSYEKNNYNESVFSHEILHCVEGINKNICPEKHVKLHANIDEYKDYYTDNMKGWYEWGAYHADYTRMKTPDGKGIVPEAFVVTDALKTKYTPIIGSKKYDTVKKDIQSACVEKIPDLVYSGREVKPKLTISDGDYSLLEGRDYSLSYIWNNRPGKACAVIEGMGDYAYSFIVPFNIIPKTPVISSVTYKNDLAKVSWSPVAGASFYELYSAASEDGEYSLVATVSDATFAEVNAKKGSAFKVRSCYELYPQKYYSMEEKPEIKSLPFEMETGTATVAFVPEYTYNGKKQVLKNFKIEFENKDGSRTELVKGKDYSIAYKYNINANMKYNPDEDTFTRLYDENDKKNPSATITFKRAYKKLGKKVIYFDIYPENMSCVVLTPKKTQISAKNGKKFAVLKSAKAFIGGKQKSISSKKDLSQLSLYCTEGEDKGKFIATSDTATLKNGRYKLYAVGKGNYYSDVYSEDEITIERW